MSTFTVTHALMSLGFGGFTVDGEAFEKVRWLDEPEHRPTKDEVQAEIARLTKTWADTEYQRKRAAEYPSISDQLDAILKGGAELDALKATVAAIKAKYPKPIEGGGK